MADGYRVVRVPVAPEPLVAEVPDYADSFEVRLDQRDAHTAEEWVRAGVDDAPRWARAVIAFAHGRIARFERGPADRQHILGWRITVSSQDVLHIQTGGPLLRASIVARRITPTAARLTTSLFYEHRATRLLWAAIGPLHRRIAPLLLRRAAAALVGDAVVRGR